jgi:hypothetical protein
VTLLILALLVPTSSASPAYATGIGSCLTGDQHGRTQASSGSGNNVGTAVITYTWQTYFLEDYSSMFSNDAAWLLDQNDVTSSIEAGIYTGVTTFGDIQHR